MECFWEYLGEKHLIIIEIGDGLWEIEEKIELLGIEFSDFKWKINDVKTLSNGDLLNDYVEENSGREESCYECEPTDEDYLGIAISNAKRYGECDIDSDSDYLYEQYKEQMRENK